MKFNYKNFSIQQEILKRVQKESQHTWAISNTNRELPKYEKSKVAPLSAGIINLVRSFLP